MGKSANRPVHPDLLIARSRIWARSAVAATSVATLGLTGWIAASTETASATTATSNTTKSSNTGTSTSTRTKSSSGSSDSNSGTSLDYTPTNSTNNAPVQGTTSGS